MSKYKAKNMKKHNQASVMFIAALLDESAALLMRHGEARTDAGKLSRDFALEVSRQLAGQLMYFGKNIHLEKATQYKLIRDDYHNGETIEQLSAKHRLSTRRIHSIIHELKDDGSTKAATTGAPAMAVVAARMMIKIGIDRVDAASAARGLLAVIAAKFGGTAIYIPGQNNTKCIIRDIEIYRLYTAGNSAIALAPFFNLSEEEIKAVVEQFPVTKIAPANLSEFTRIRRYVLDVAASFKEINPDVHDLLESATKNISRAEEIIQKLKGDEAQCHH